MKDGLFSQAYFDNPYPYYKHLRDHEPIFHDDRIGWMVTRYADIRALARRRPRTRVHPAQCSKDATILLEHPACAAFHFAKSESGLRELERGRSWEARP